MKPKITRGAGFRGLFNYIMDEGARAVGDKRPEWIGGTMGGQDARELSREIEQVRTLRPDIARPVWHCSLNLPHGERLDTDRWREVAEDFMRRMGFGDKTPWVAVRHNDRQHDHIHIVASRIDVSGQIWKGQFEAKNAIAVCQHMEITYNLQRTKGPERGPTDDRRPTANELRQAERTGVDPARERLKGAICRALEGRPTMEEYERRLVAEGIQPLPNIASTGRMNGYAYEIGGIRFKGSQLGRDYSWSALQRRGAQYHGPGASREASETRPMRELSVASWHSGGKSDLADSDEHGGGRQENQTFPSGGAAAIVQRVATEAARIRDNAPPPETMPKSGEKSKAAKKEEARKARANVLYEDGPEL